MWHSQSEEAYRWRTVIDDECIMYPVERHCGLKTCSEMRGSAGVERIEMKDE